MEGFYYLLWFIISVSVAFAFIQLGIFLGRLRNTVKLLTEELVPLLKTLNETSKKLDSDLSRIDSTVENIEELSNKVNATVKAVQAILSSPLAKLAGFSAGAKKAISSLVKGK